MKRCNDCKTFGRDDQLFCDVCGSSFGVRFCSRLHANPPTVTYCRTCGSAQLSRPHRLPQRRFRPRGLGIALLLVTAFFLAFAIYVAFASPIPLSLDFMFLVTVTVSILLLLLIPIHR
jgi:RNA polymerase subunit RPABC4/transcription elongation factor Spt4